MLGKYETKSTFVLVFNFINSTYEVNGCDNGQNFSKQEVDETACTRVHQMQLGLLIRCITLVQKTSVTFISYRIHPIC